MRDDLKEARAQQGILRAELDEARVELALLRKEREEQLEMERLSVEIWGPSTRARPDATWDPEPVLLMSDAERVPIPPPPYQLMTEREHALCKSNPATAQNPPVSIARIAGELGFKNEAHDVHRLGSQVRQAFLLAHGKSPELKIYYDKQGVPERISCFAESDRGLIEETIRRHGERREDDR